MKKMINNSNSTMKEHETSTNVLSIEVFLDEHYAFRHNVLNGKTEFAKRAEDGSVEEYRVLTQKALNSIVIQAKREDVFEEGGSKSDIQEYINSEEVESYDPIQHYLNNLPAWDGQNHVAKLFSRLPGISSEQLNFLTIWMRSAVAHWLQMDVEHGNECVPTLIGAQGCGKTTFLRRLLPMHLREYYLDHLNLSAGSHPSQPACTAETDAVEVEGERTPHLWCLAGRSPSLRVVRSHYEQSASADRPHGFASLHLHDDS